MFGSVLGARAHDASSWTLTRMSANVQTAANVADGPTVFWEEQTLDLTNFEVQDETVFIGSIQPQHIGAFAAEGAFNGAVMMHFSAMK